AFFFFGALLTLLFELLAFFAATFFFFFFLAGAFFAFLAFALTFDLRFFAMIDLPICPTTTLPPTGRQISLAVAVLHRRSPSRSVRPDGQPGSRCLPQAA